MSARTVYVWGNLRPRAGSVTVDAAFSEDDVGGNDDVIRLEELNNGRLRLSGGVSDLTPAEAKRLAVLLLRAARVDVSALEDPGRASPAYMPPSHEREARRRETLTLPPVSKIRRGTVAELEDGTAAEYSPPALELKPGNRPPADPSDVAGDPDLSILSGDKTTVE